MCAKIAEVQLSNTWPQTVNHSGHSSVRSVGVQFTVLTSCRMKIICVHCVGNIQLHNHDSQSLLHPHRLCSRRNPRSAYQFNLINKMFNYQGSRWHTIEAETNPNMKKAGYVLICRPPSYWIMKKQGGQMATKIDAKPENLPKSVRLLAEKIVANY